MQHDLIEYKEEIKHHGEKKDSLINDVGRFIRFFFLQKKNSYICHHEPKINDSVIRELSRKNIKEN